MRMAGELALGHGNVCRAAAVTIMVAVETGVAGADAVVKAAVAADPHQDRRLSRHGDGDRGNLKRIWPIFEFAKML